MDTRLSGSSTFSFLDDPMGPGPVSVSLAHRLDHYRRVLDTYLLRRPSALDFWYERPAENPPAFEPDSAAYYMTFADKADYAGPFDAEGVPMLRYGGSIGTRYNPIAIAQFGLGNLNHFLRDGDEQRRRKVLVVADWLAANLEKNRQGIPVWNHTFDWPYRDLLVAPWYSGLSQGQGISLLVRADRVASDRGYLQAAAEAFQAFEATLEEGGVVHIDATGRTWFEEYIVPPPPTHILNGFMWAAWGVRDHSLATGDPGAGRLFESAVATLTETLESYDTGFWSLYELSETRLPMVASAFYHRLHIVQLRIMERLTGVGLFASVADRWEAYEGRWWNRARARALKAAFKVVHY